MFCGRMQALSVTQTAFASQYATSLQQKLMDDSSFQQSAEQPRSPAPLPLIVKIAIAMTFLNTLVIFLVWPGVLLRVCF